MTVKLVSRTIVVSDRTFYDSMIDQSINLGGKSLLQSLDWPLLRFIFRRPDLVIYINCPAHAAFGRKNDVVDVSALEERAFLYNQLALKYKWLVFDGTLSINEIFSGIKNTVEKDLNL